MFIKDMMQKIRNAPTWSWIMIILLIIILIIIIISFTSRSLSSSESFNNKVIERYTNKSLDSNIVTDSERLKPEENEIMIVKFYAPWCGYCKKLVPDWNKLEQGYHKKRVNGKVIYVLKVNCDEYPKIGESYQVQGYPTIKILTNSGDKDYEGPRNVSGMEKFLIDECQA